MYNFIPSEKNQVDQFIYKTQLEGLLYISAKKFSDDRGFYAEIARIPEIEALNQLSFSVKQINISHSKKNVARGFHAENWNKLLTVAQGEAFCVWADLRPGSTTFGECVSMTLSSSGEGSFGSMFVPAGVANSFCTLSESLDYVYTVDALYAERDPANDVAVSLFDPDLNITWPINQSQMIVSERDYQSLTIRQKFPEKYR